MEMYHKYTILCTSHWYKHCY